MKSKNSLLISNKAVVIFLIALSIPWLVLSGKLMADNVALGIRLLVFGAAFLVVFYYVQLYFRKMLVLYQQNLGQSSKKYQSKK